MEGILDIIQYYYISTDLLFPIYALSLHVFCLNTFAYDFSIHTYCACCLLNSSTVITVFPQIYNLMWYLYQQSVLYTHLSSTTEDPKSPNLETALKAFMFHGRLSAHLQHKVRFLFCMHYVSPLFFFLIALFSLFTRACLLFSSDTWLYIYTFSGAYMCELLRQIKQSLSLSRSTGTGELLNFLTWMVQFFELVPLWDILFCVSKYKLLSFLN